MGGNPIQFFDTAVRHLVLQGSKLAKNLSRHWYCTVIVTGSPYLAT